MVKLSDLKRSEQVWADLEARDPEFRDEWQRLVLARAVVAEAADYRKQHGTADEAISGEPGSQSSQ